MEHVGPYRILHKLATGGMAEVFLARHRGPEGFERTVVLKRVLPEYAGEPELVTMFLDEARLLATLCHPHIAQVYELGEDDTAHYLVMEHVPGPTLGALLEAAEDRGQAGLPRAQALGIGLAIAEALVYLHGLQDELGRSLGIVHRDLNPSNVVVSRDGAVKLIDFGIAKAATKVHETRTGVVKGTEGYIAPEQRRRDAVVNYRADLFALGVVLYEMCVGEHPLGLTVDARPKPARPPRELDPTLPQALSELIMRCMAKDPDERPGNVQDMVDALSAALAAEGVVPTLGARAAMVEDLVPPGRSDSAPPPPRRAPGTDSDLDDSTLELMPSDEAATRAHRAPPDPDDERTVARPRPDPGGGPTMELELEGTPDEGRTVETRPVRGSAAAGVAAQGTASTPPSDVAPTGRAAAVPSAETDEASSGAPTAPRGPPLGLSVGVRRALLAAVAAAVALGVGLVAFVTTRALTAEAGGSEQQATPNGSTEARAPSGDEDERAQPVRGAERVLRILSEPTDAKVAVDGTIVGTTPTYVPVPEGRERMWVRVSMDGYVTEERPVLTSAGEARFVLDPLGRVEDGGGP